jgi:hypothetical protein
MPAIDRAVYCQQRFSGYFSYLHLIWHVYPKINKFFDEQRFQCRLTIEVLSGNRLSVFCPLDHTEEYLVPEVCYDIFEQPINNGYLGPPN